MMWPIIAATAAGAGAGWMLARQLRTLDYRRPDELDLPQPRNAWWLTFATALAWGWLTWHLAGANWPAPVLWLPLSAALGWLSAVDLDVRRLPDKVMWPAAGWVTLTLLAQAVITRSVTSGLLPLAFGLAAGIAAWIIHHTSRGALGFGDVKLVAILTTSIALINPGLILPALLASCLIAIATSLPTHQRQFPFGPSLAAGHVLAIGLAQLV